MGHINTLNPKKEFEPAKGSSRTRPKIKQNDHRFQFITSEF